jgi:hypothetical protein
MTHTDGLSRLKNNMRFMDQSWKAEMESITPNLVAEHNGGGLKLLEKPKSVVRVFDFEDVTLIDCMKSPTLVRVDTQVALSQTRSGNFLETKSPLPQQKRAL